MTRIRLWAGTAMAVLLTLTAVGCGVPTGGSPTVIDPSDVPYELASPREPTSAVHTTPATGDEPRVYLLTEEGTLVPRGRSVPVGQLEDRLADLLDDLASGPTSTELTERLSTALRPATTLSVTDLDEDGVATIDVGGSADAPSGRGSRRTVGQIVLTATSLPGVRSVRLTRTGEPVDAPLPSGELTARPLAAADYQVLLAPTAAPPS